MAEPRHLSSINDLLLPAVLATIAELELSDQDQAAIRLATTYAEAMDQSDDPAVLERLGPKLLAVLVELGATPKARAGLQKAPERPKAKSPLEILREARSS